MIDKNFWQGKKVFITGHTGFKGSWLCLWLWTLGADITGYALNPPTQPNMYELCNIQELITSIYGDVRDLTFLTTSLVKAQPEILIHMAAQPLVQESYKIPVETYEINVMGTLHVLEAVRQCPSLKAVINVTTDKCYENKEWPWGYRENETLGGYDPYSNSKACAELITSSYRCCFFNPAQYAKHGVALASARAGNVIGGGDWSPGRLLPDCLASLLQHEKIKIRNPHAIRPWQHVLEPLYGYLLLAQQLYEKGPLFGEAWNFGPRHDDAQSVKLLVEKLCQLWGSNGAYEIDKTVHPHEAHYLKLDCSKAHIHLNWFPCWNLEHTLVKIIQWAQTYQQQGNLRALSLEQINEYITWGKKVNQ